MDMITGGCLCKRVSYRISTPITSLGHCHCTMCQRYHGTAYSTYAMVAKSSYEIAEGEHELRTAHTSEHVQRKFCGYCGSPISYENEASPNNIWITAGSLDAAPNCEPQYHIFVTTLDKTQ